MKRRTFLSAVGLAGVALLPLSKIRLTEVNSQELREFKDKPPYGFVPPHTDSCKKDKNK